MKPVIAIKAGRHSEAAKAVASHTGALAGADAVYDAAFRRAGMLRVYQLDELFAAAQTLAMSRIPGGDRLAIMTNGGGMGILATDTLIDTNGKLAELAPATLQKLDGVLPAGWSHGNPVDIIGDAPAERFAAATGILRDDPYVDALLVLNCPTAIADAVAAADAVIGAVAGSKLCVMTSWVGEATAGEARRRFASAGIPTYETPEAAARAFSHVAEYRRNRELLMETPPSMPTSFQVEMAPVRKIVEAALKRTMKGEVAKKPVLSSWSSVIDYCRLAMAFAEREQFRILFLDKKNALIADEVQQTGTVDHTPVYPREVMRRALELSATALILVHNHPSGDPTPSGADMRMTRELVDIAKPLGIAIHDHIIVGRDGHASFKGLGLI